MKQFDLIAFIAKKVIFELGRVKGKYSQSYLERIGYRLDLILGHRNPKKEKKMKGLVLLCLAVQLFVLCSASIAQADWAHILNGDLESEMMDPDPDDWPPVYEKKCIWIFNSVADHTLSDPSRPAFVSGPSGPWTITLVDHDPYGNLMPHKGIKFTLDPGGIPYSSHADKYVAHPTELFDHSLNPVITEYWQRMDGTIIAHSGTVRYQWVDVIPPEYMTDARTALDYVYSQISREPRGYNTYWLILTAIFLMLAGGYVILRRRRKMA